MQYAGYIEFASDYDSDTFFRWNSNQKKILRRVRNFIGEGRKGTILCEDEFVKESLNVVYGIKSEEIDKKWYLVIQ